MVWQRAFCALLALAFLGVLDNWRRAPTLPAPQGAWLLSAQPPSAPPKLVSQGSGLIPMPPDTPAAHASTLLALPAASSSSVMAFWFAGSRESGPDVQIAMSHFDRSRQAWSEARFVVQRDASWQRTDYAVRRLGNPVAWLDASGRIHVFVVGTGLGGWAAGRVVHYVQKNEVGHWGDVQFRFEGVLPLSWLWNTSHLVRAMPLPLQDGGMVLPAYFELGTKYPVALRFDAQGAFQGMVRISQRGYLLQPTLLMRSPTEWLALMRDNSPDKQLRLAQTTDGGQTWLDLPDAELRNPDASVVGLSLQPGLMMLAYNPLPDSRGELALSTSSDGLRWSQTLTLAQGQGEGPHEYSYPSMTWADNSLWVSYTDHRRAIAWQRFGLRP
jgi:predicted neuraminidase